MRTTTTLGPWLIIFSLAAIGCGGPSTQGPEPEMGSTSPPPSLPGEPAKPEEPEPEPKKAPTPSVEVTIESKSGSTLNGKGTVSEVEGGARLIIEVTNAPPGKHGAHVHEKGDCSSPDGKSAGGHFNPAGHDHALPEKEQRHLGDLGNIEVDADGNGKLELTIPGANLQPGHAHSFLGRSIIIHEKADDGGQPTGNAGGRIGCGVIGKSES